MPEEHDRLVLTADISDAGLKIGDVGTMVHVCPQRRAFEVEFLALDGSTAVVSTILPSQTRRVTPTDITHARALGMSG